VFTVASSSHLKFEHINFNGISYFARESVRARCTVHIGLALSR